MREAAFADLEAVAVLIGWGGDDAALSSYLLDPMSICLIEGENCALFVWRGPWIFEVHIALSERGRPALILMRAMLDHVKATRGARLFWAAIPWDGSKQSRKVRLFARNMGFKSHGLANLAHGLNELFVGE